MFLLKSGNLLIQLKCIPNHYINMKTFCQLILLTLFIPLCLQGQAPLQPTASEIHHEIKKLRTVGSVLYIAAHPDDENTRMIAYLANERKMNTAYLSLTRGDGGQNLIGPEIRELIGVMRTQELLMARSIDGGKQFFSRANDFGYSKNADETFNIWNKKDVLSDMVWIIRKFQPDVLMTRFPHTPAPTHGHHTASAQLAYEAFDAAADPSRFPEQLQFVKPWQTKRLFYNSIPRYYGNEEDFEKIKGDLLSVDVGAYYPLLGKSNNEISAESRSMHKCQGMGTMSERGSSTEYLEHLKGDKATSDIFEGINTEWSRIEGGKAIGVGLRQIDENFDASKPAASVPALIKIRKNIIALTDNEEAESQASSYYKTVKLAEIDAVIKACLGLYLTANADDFAYAGSESAKVKIEAINRAAIPVKLAGFQYGKKTEMLNQPLAANQSFQVDTELRIPVRPGSRPYWLEKEGSLGMYTVAQQEDRGKPEIRKDLVLRFKLEIEGTTITYPVPLTYKRNDPVDGEIYRHVEISPDVSVNLKEKVIVFADNTPKTINVLVKSGKSGPKGRLHAHLPDGWRAEPPAHALGFTGEKGEEQTVQFQIYPAKKQSTGELTLAWETYGEKPIQQRIEINYPHIPVQLMFMDAKAKVVKLDIQKRGESIGYYMGAGDDIPASLEQIGYTVTLLTDDAMTAKQLKKFDAVILGVRAYNTRPRLKFHQPHLMEYVKQGGTVIVQYNTNFRLVTEDLSPYPLTLSRDRVTVEEAEVRFLLPDHPVLNTPNKITAADFENWVQERGLYFPNKWDDRYSAILSANDPNEPARDGGLLVAKHGEGHFIYTGYSWFRELPAGVPGAYRVFANLISVGK